MSKRANFILNSILFSFISIFFTGCWVARFVVAESGGLGRIALSAADRALLRAGSMEVTAGRIVATDAISFNSQLGKFRLGRISGRNPHLYFEGRANPIAEVLPKEGKIRLLDYTNEFPIQNNIFSIENNVLHVYSTRSISPSNVIATLKKGDLIIKLTEYKGWYQIQCIQKGKEIYGYITGSLLLPLVTGNLLGYCEEYNLGNYCFHNNTDTNLYVSLMLRKEHVAQEYQQRKILPDETQCFCNLGSHSWYYEIHYKWGRQYSNRDEGTIMVDICKTQSHEIY